LLFLFYVLVFLVGSPISLPKPSPAPPFSFLNPPRPNLSPRAPCPRENRPSVPWIRSCPASAIEPAGIDPGLFFASETLLLPRLFVPSSRTTCDCRCLICPWAPERREGTLEHCSAGIFTSPFLSHKVLALATRRSIRFRLWPGVRWESVS
jgi:hypothetical protein